MHLTKDCWKISHLRGGKLLKVIALLKYNAQICVYDFIPSILKVTINYYSTHGQKKKLRNLSKNGNENKLEY